jgi:hypothetical protein
VCVVPVCCMSSFLHMVKLVCNYVLSVKWPLVAFRGYIIIINSRRRVFCFAACSTGAGTGTSRYR